MQDGGRVRLVWSRDSSGYALVQRRQRGSTILAERADGTYIAPRGGNPKNYEKGLDASDILTELVNAKTSEKALAFVTKWGLPDRPYRLHHNDEMALDKFFAIREDLAWAMDAKPTAVKKHLASLRPTPKDPDIYRIYCDLYGEDGADQMFGIDEPSLGSCRVTLDKKNRLVLRPHSLIQFCRMQVLEADFSHCLGCGDYLPHNPRVGRPKDYCSDACKYRKWRKNKKIKKL